MTGGEALRGGPHQQADARTGRISHLSLQRADVNVFSGLAIGTSHLHTPGVFSRDVNAAGNKPVNTHTPNTHTQSTTIKGGIQTVSVRWREGG